MLTALGLIAIAALPTAVFGLAITLPRLGGRLLAARRRRQVAAGVLLPAWPPIEQLAARLRRARVAAEHPRRPRAAREGARLAYLDLLVEACRRFEITFSADALLRRRGRTHLAELMRVEAALARSGLDVTGGTARAA